uniref:Uncharacterized protein n=1 Tax=Arundo donax TaxID=35708 RepID=A0A0A9HL72_ARUDO
MSISGAATWPLRSGPRGLGDPEPRAPALGRVAVGVCYVSGSLRAVAFLTLLGCRVSPYGPASVVWGTPDPMSPTPCIRVSEVLHF